LGFKHALSYQFNIPYQISRKQYYKLLSLSTILNPIRTRSSRIFTFLLWKRKRGTSCNKGAVQKGRILKSKWWTIQEEGITPPYESFIMTEHLHKELWQNTSTFFITTCFSTPLEHSLSARYDLFYYLYPTMISLTTQLSTRIHQLPSFFGVSKIGTTHGLKLSWIIPFFNNSSIFSLKISPTFELIM